jgi:hypothetical protein
MVVVLLMRDIIVYVDEDGRSGIADEIKIDDIDI